MLVHHISHRNALGINPGLCDEMLVINCLSSGTAMDRTMHLCLLNLHFHSMDSIKVKFMLYRMYFLPVLTYEAQN